MKNPTARIVLVTAALLGVAAPARAQFDGAHVYWTLPINTNILGVTAVKGGINAAFTNFHRVEPTIRVDNNLYLLSFSRSLGLFGRSMVVTAILPAGSIGADIAAPAGAGLTDEFVHGVADPSLGFWINFLGAPAQKVKDYVRYEQGTTLALNVSGTFPLGQYDEESPLNIGGNQWKLRLGLPIVQSIGAWVPGRRTTIEITPTATFVSENSASLGQSIEQDATYAVEAHASRDITKRAFLSLDYSYIRLGASTYTSNQTGEVVRSSDAVATHLLGLTAGFEVNENLRLFVSHFQTTADDIDAVDLQGELLKVMLSWSWHTVLERLRELE